MIVVYHSCKKVTQIDDVDSGLELELRATTIAATLCNLATEFPDRLLVWCDEELSGRLDIDSVGRLFSNKQTMISYAAGANYLQSAIGYVEDSTFININRDVRYATWQMSADSGAIYGATLTAVAIDVRLSDDFGYFLNSVAKLAMPEGLFCYSEPRLLIDRTTSATKTADNRTLFCFVRQHFKVTWVFLLLLNLFLYEKRFPIFAAIQSLFYRRRRFANQEFSQIADSSDFNFADVSIDVLIPTIGRKKYLRDVLDDLATQTLLPRKVILVEQNPLPESESELDYLSMSWPFEIKHIFTHRTGACHARNRGLVEFTADWLFFADDDIRLRPDFLEEAFAKILALKGGAFNICCLNRGKEREYDKIQQTYIFGAGCSIVSRECLGNSRFDTAFEFGFGEDSDLGMQLMNKGFDIVYLPSPIVLHLKAPFGGFRVKPVHEWDSDKIQPKPAPTVLLFKRKHFSREQIYGYKTTLCLKFYRVQSIKNPFSYLKHFRRQWQRSIYWSDKLLQNNNANP